MSDKRVRHNQAGMVSITVTLVMMIVISLIVIGFSQVVRRNQREALDRQLSTQAYYAAETGVNDAYAALFPKSGTPLSLAPADATDCTSLINKAHLVSSLNADSTVGYTCLLASNTSSSVTKPVPYGDSESVSLQSTVAPGSLNFRWDVDTSPPTSGRVATCPAQFTPANSWTAACPYGILRVDLYNADAGSGDANAMTNATSSVFFVPSASGASQTIVAGKSTYKIKASCNATTCTGTVGGINGTNYYARLSNVYRSTGTVYITPGNSTAKFTGYVTIDATGKAQDELRRVQVRVPDSTQTNFPMPLNALTNGGNVCKRFVTAPDLFVDRCSTDDTLDDADPTD